VGWDGMGVPRTVIAGPLAQPSMGVPRTVIAGPLAQPSMGVPRTVIAGPLAQPSMTFFATGCQEECMCLPLQRK
jgi:hypothetical protein